MPVGVTSVLSNMASSQRCCVADDDDDDDGRINFNVHIVLRLQGHVTVKKESRIDDALVIVLVGTAV